MNIIPRNCSCEIKFHPGISIAGLHCMISDNGSDWNETENRPVVIDFGHSVSLSLSGSETQAEQITLMFSNDAGETQHIVIQTAHRKVIPDIQKAEEAIRMAYRLPAAGQNAQLLKIESRAPSARP